MEKLLLLVCSFCWLSLSAQEGNGDILRQGDRLPDFELSSATYGTVTPADLKGKVAVISVFATWCSPCQKELAKIEETLWPQFRAEDNFVLLVVGREHTEREVITYREKKGFSFPIYPDPDRKFTAKFSTHTIPRIYLADKSGKIIYASTGYNPEDFKVLMNKIERALKE
ncbi:MAG: TlpA family protein disulfide reductase [Bacteroides sp.]|nr:TlpA family protein disulfide reductase [Bacteroides sp.]